MKYMSLTSTDLNAIATLFDKRFDKKIKPELGALNYKIDRIYEELTKRTDSLDAAVSQLQNSVNRIENVQAAEASRADRHDTQIARLNRELGLL